MSTTLLCILDGFGLSDAKEHNAIYSANTPNIDRMVQQYPNSQLATSGRDVGLPDGQMGNSEVGHMNIGSGRIMMQNLPLIDTSIADGSLARHMIIDKSTRKLKESGKSMHIIGLVSDGGVHAHQNHILALAGYYNDAGINTYIHIITDGRDVPPKSALESLLPFLAEIREMENVRIATIAGRFYAMDRDNRWERTKLAYDAIALGDAPVADDISQLLEDSYKIDISDEFIKPHKLADYDGIKENDGFIMANFRADRARQILHALVDPNFKGFKRQLINIHCKLGMVEYSTALSQYMHIFFLNETPNNILAQIIADNNMKQLRIAETEKYAHVTFFFNGGIEEKFAGEDRVLIPSPDVKTYDLKPEMSAIEVTDKLVEAIELGKYDFIAVNYANSDMVGHTGSFNAAVKAIEALDVAVGRLEKAILDAGGRMLITADHGNSEEMVDENGVKHTQHTLNPVPFIMVANDNLIDGVALQNGRLCDIAPTILDLMGLQKPDEMSGESLI